jgi:hypothetical protein
MFPALDKYPQPVFAAYHAELIAAPKAVLADRTGNGFKAVGFETVPYRVSIAVSRYFAVIKAACRALGEDAERQKHEFAQSVCFQPEVLLICYQGNDKSIHGFPERSRDK